MVSTNTNMVYAIGKWDIAMNGMGLGCIATWMGCVGVVVPVALYICIVCPMPFQPHAKGGSATIDAKYLLAIFAIVGCWNRRPARRWAFCRLRVLYIHMYIYMHTGLYIHMYMHTYCIIHTICTYIHMHAYWIVHTVHTCIHTVLYICMYTHMHAYWIVHTYECMYVHMYSHMYI